MLIFGEISDIYGPRAAMSSGLFFVCGGFFVVALDPHHIYSWYASLVLLGFGGPGVTISIFALGQSMPDLDWLVSSMLSATFDGSSFVLNLFAVIYKTGVPVRTIFVAYFCMCAVVGVGVLLLLPEKEDGPCSCISKKKDKEDQLKDLLEEGSENKRSTSGSGSAISNLARSRSKSSSKSTDNADTLLDTVLDRRGAILDGGDGILAMLQRKDTVFLILWMGFYRLKCTWYMGQIQDQMKQQLTADEADNVLNAFTWCFPILAAVTAIPSSFILNRFGGKEDVYMAIVLFLEAVVCICNIFPNYYAQFTAAIVFGPAQTMQWGTYFHFMYQGYRYPEAKAGRMIGFVNLLMSVIGDVLPIALTQVQSAYQVTFTQINILLAGAVIIFGSLLVSHLRSERLLDTYEVGRRCCCFRKGARMDMQAESTIASGWG
jgi:MFS family permease